VQRKSDGTKWTRAKDSVIKVTCVKSHLSFSFGYENVKFWKLTGSGSCVVENSSLELYAV
jgi:hypothetical protein